MSYHFQERHLLVIVVKFRWWSSERSLQSVSWFERDVVRLTLWQREVFSSWHCQSMLTRTLNSKTHHQILYLTFWMRKQLDRVVISRTDMLASWANVMRMTRPSIYTHICYMISDHSFRAASRLYGQRGELHWHFSTSWNFLVQLFILIFRRCHQHQHHNSFMDITHVSQSISSQSLHDEHSCRPYLTTQKVMVIYLSFQTDQLISQSSQTYHNIWHWHQLTCWNRYIDFNWFILQIIFSFHALWSLPTFSGKFNSSHNHNMMKHYHIPC